MELADLVGFVVVVTGVFSYEFFARFPITRDFPWANRLLLGIGIALLIAGLFRALVDRRFTAERFSDRSLQRLLWLLSRFSATKSFTLAAGAGFSCAPRVGQKAPDFLLLDQNGKPVGLGDLLSNSRVSW